MPDEYKVTGISLKAYWNYYINDKKSIINKDEKPYTEYPFDVDRSRRRLDSTATIYTLPSSKQTAHLIEQLQTLKSI